MNPQQEKPTILLVDDDIYNQVLITEILEGSRVISMKLNQEKEIIRLIEGSVFISLVLISIKPPLYQHTGIDLCVQIKTRNTRLPIIALPATTHLGLTRHCINSGFSAYITKPFDVVEFLKLVSSYVKIPDSFPY